MKPIKFHPNNRPYFSEDFIKGFECGAQRQFEADKRRIGEWVDNISKTYPGWIHCSECDEVWTGNGKPGFCPNCGAAMKNGYSVEMSNVHVTQ